MSDPAQSAEAVENTTAPAAAVPQGDAGAAPQGGPRGPRGPRGPYAGGAPGGFGSPAGGIMGRNLYIKNLDESVGDKELKEAFEKFGEITSAKIMMDDKSPPQSRGFGFVCFKELASATRAIAEMNGHVLGSKPLYVNVAQRKDQRQQAMATHFNQHGPVGGMPGVPPYQGYPPFGGNQFPGGFGGFGFPPAPRGGMPQGGRGWPVPGMPGMPVQMPMQWGPAPGPRGAPPRGV